MIAWHCDRRSATASGLVACFAATWQLRSVNSAGRSRKRLKLRRYQTGGGDGATCVVKTVSKFAVISVAGAFASGVAPKLQTVKSNSMLRIGRAFCWKAFCVTCTPMRELIERCINIRCRDSVPCSSMLRQ